MSHHTKNLYDKLLGVLSSKRFLTKQGLGNEVPFFICPYDPAEANEVARIVEQLISKLQTMNISVLKIDLFDLTIELLKARTLWDKILEKETLISKAELKELLQGLLDAEVHLIPAISKKMDGADFQILFLTGIGEVFPYIRSHNVLNNLQKIANEQPTLMFFPGEYNHSEEDGAVLQLFNRLRDDKYYRAFNIKQYEV